MPVRRTSTLFHAAGKFCKKKINFMHAVSVLLALHTCTRSPAPFRFQKRTLVWSYNFMARLLLLVVFFAFSALTLLVWLAKTGDEVLAWLSVWSEVQMICIWSSWCHYHSIISCSSKIQNGLPFWWRLTLVFLEKRPLNGCSSSSSIFKNTCSNKDPEV